MNTLPIIVFFSLVLVVLFATHFFVYVSITRFINLNNGGRRGLGFSLAILSLGFIGSSIFGHYFDNFVSQSLYLLTSSWLGLFSNLFWAVIIFWPAFLLLEKKAEARTLAIIMATMLAAVIMFTVFGYFNAKNIYYRQESVKINNLPAWWQRKKVVQLSDVHLNNIHDEKFFEPIIAKINEEKVAAVFLTGDFFDGMDGNLTAISTELKNLIAEKGIYFISGNHEMYMGLELAEKALAENGVKILDDGKVNVEGLDIAGVKFPERDGLRRDLVKELTALDVQAPSIFLYHDPRQVDEVAATGRVSLMLSGHTHNGQLWPYNYFVRWIYGQYAIGRHQVGEMTQFTTTGAGTWGPPIRTTGRPEVVIFTLE